MLIGAGVRLSASNPMFQLGAASAGSAERAAWLGPGKLRNLQAGYAGISGLSGYPNGVRHPAAWSLPNKAGALASRNETGFTLTEGSLSLAAGRNIDGSTTITVSVPDAELQLVVSASGTTAITLSQTGAVAGALAAEGNAPLTITVPTATLGAIVSSIASGALTLTGSAGIRATGVLAGDILPYTDLSPEALAISVWNAVAANSNVAGSMGEKLNDAGSASNPWTEVIESGYTAAEVLRIIAAVAAGKTSIVDLGGGDATVTFRDLGDTKDRIVADVSGSERTTLSFDET